jgi:hypothetical protein
MSNSWFRLYGEIVHDPKVIILPEALRWRYVALLCLHCNDQFENRPADEIALSLRVTLEEWSVTLEEFIRRGLVTKTGKIHGWEKRQYISDIKDSTAAERQKRYRERKRNDRNAPVTSRLPESDTDTDTEKQEDQNTLVATSSDPSQADEPPKPKPSRKTRLPADITLAPEWSAAAIHYWQPLQRFDLTPETEFEKFVAFHRSRGSTMVDWSCAWKTWYCNAVKFNTPRIPTHANHQRSDQRQDTSAVGRVRAAIERDRAREGLDPVAVGNHGLDVRAQVGEQLRSGSGSGPGVGVVLEGDFTRAD